MCLPGPHDLHQVVSVVLAILVRILLVHGFQVCVGGGAHRQRCAGTVIALDIVLRIPIGAQLVVELLLIVFPAAQEECDAIVGARHDERNAGSGQPGGGLAAQPVSHYDSIIPLTCRRVNRRLKLGT